MAVFTDIHNIPRFKHAAITIGTFDGVHTGHRVILQEVVGHAAQAGGESVLLTFDPHPRKLLFPHQPLGIITPLPQKLQLVHDAGIDHTVVVPFTREFSNLSAQEYIEQFIVDIFRPERIIIGYDHHFGHDRMGNIGLLKKYASLHSYEVVEIPAQLIDEAAVSSTKIRNALLEGRAADAAHMLGRNYTLTGSVVHGSKIGRTIGYPTANIAPGDPDQIVPGIGIYAVRARVAGETLNGMLSIGYNPTVTDRKELRIEVNLFNFDRDIYGAQLELIFVQKIRDEQRFNGLQELTAQLHLDKVETLRLLQL